GSPVSRLAEVSIKACADGFCFAGLLSESGERYQSRWRFDLATYTSSEPIAVQSRHGDVKNGHVGVGGLDDVQPGQPVIRAARDIKTGFFKQAGKCRIGVIVVVDYDHA